jgi:nucleoid DNA-binding protein
MNKSDLVLEVARIAGLSRAVSETVVTAMFERITEALVKGERVELRGLGTFAVRQRRARTGEPAPRADRVPAGRSRSSRWEGLQAILNRRGGRAGPRMKVGDVMTKHR